MGIKVSTTCEVTFGDGAAGPGLAARRGARRHRADVPGHRERPDDGRHQGHRDAVHRLPERARVRQEPRAGRRPHPGLGQDRAARDDHPPPRRTPLADDPEVVRRGAARAGALHRVVAGPGAGRRARRASATRLAERVNDLLLPIVKGYGSERSWVLLGTESLQTFGGSGFLQDYPIEQYVRDAKIDTLYEGTTAIQGQDLFFRKIVKDQAPGAGPPGRRDRGVHRERGRQRPAQGRARAARDRAWRTPRRSSAR